MLSIGHRIIWVIPIISQKQLFGIFYAMQNLGSRMQPISSVQTTGNLYIYNPPMPLPNALFQKVPTVTIYRMTCLAQVTPLQCFLSLLTFRTNPKRLRRHPCPPEVPYCLLCVDFLMTTRRYHHSHYPEWVPRIRLHSSWCPVVEPRSSYLGSLLQLCVSRYLISAGDLEEAVQGGIVIGVPLVAQMLDYCGRQGCL